MRVSTIAFKPQFGRAGNSNFYPLNPGNPAHSRRVGNLSCNKGYFPDYLLSYIAIIFTKAIYIIS